MLILSESPAGFALFKVDDKKIKDAESNVSWRAEALHGAAWAALHAYIQQGAVLKAGLSSCMQDMWNDFQTLDAAKKVRSVMCVLKPA